MKVIEFQNYWGNNMDFELKSVKNFRDLGNIKTKDNKKIKENLLFRSASLDSLSEDEYLLLKNKCNLQLVIDFRSETSFINKPDKTSITISISFCSWIYDLCCSRRIDTRKSN